MNRDLAALTAAPFDVLVIGGGILGAGIARDAALRGLRVALIDKGDFASGTSSASSKLIHGGFRYLEQCAFHLVTESCRERAILRHIAPRLVQPQPILFPVYERDPHSLLALRLGATLYDWLARGRRIAPHQSLSAAAVRAKEPALTPTGLRGAVLFYDCREDDARFCLENILHAAALGAVCANYCELTGFTVRGNRLIAARVTDRIRQESFEISARAFINAAGPWVESVAGFAPFAEPIRLSPTKGVHLLFPRLTEGTGILFPARRDGRVIFVFSWGDCSLVGSTDTDWQGDAGAAHADAADVEYLLAEVNWLLPNARPQPSDIITSFAGVRALLRSDAAHPSQRSREHRIVRQGENFITVAGGKYTTYRLIAEQVVNQLSPKPCRTADTPLPPHRPAPSGGKIAGEVFTSDIIHACEYEMAQTVTDVMRRRTGLALSQHGGVETASQVARLMAAQTGRNMDASLQEYLNAHHRASRFQ